VHVHRAGQHQQSGRVVLRHAGTGRHGLADGLDAAAFDQDVGDAIVDGRDDAAIADQRGLGRAHTAAPLRSSSSMRLHSAAADWRAAA
jgi:hypothetical protein